MSKQPHKISSSQAIIAVCEAQGVKYIFGYPGGSNIPILDALLDSPIKLVMMRGMLKTGSSSEFDSSGKSA